MLLMVGRGQTWTVSYFPDRELDACVLGLTQGVKLLYKGKPVEPDSKPKIEGDAGATLETFYLGEPDWEQATERIRTTPNYVLMAPGKGGQHHAAQLRFVEIRMPSEGCVTSIAFETAEVSISFGCPLGHGWAPYEDKRPSAWERLVIP